MKYFQVYISFSAQMGQFVGLWVLYWQFSFSNQFDDHIHRVLALASNHNTDDPNGAQMDLESALNCVSFIALFILSAR
jgi:hypothetical protein